MLVLNLALPTFMHRQASPDCWFSFPPKHLPTFVRLCCRLKGALQTYDDEEDEEDMRRSEVPAVHHLCRTMHSVIRMHIDQESEGACCIEPEAGHRGGAARPQDAVPAHCSLAWTSATTICS